MDRLIKDYLKDALNAIEIEYITELVQSDLVAISPGGAERFYDVKYIDSNECYQLNTIKIDVWEVLAFVYNKV